MVLYLLSKLAGAATNPAGIAALAAVLALQASGVDVIGFAIGALSPVIDGTVTWLQSMIADVLSSLVPW